MGARLINEITGITGISIEVIELDGRLNNPEEGPEKVKSFSLKPKNFILKYQLKFEEYYFKKQAFRQRDQIISFLHEIPYECLFPQKKGFVDFFTNEETEKLLKYNLDVIFRFGFNIIKGELFTLAKYGVWSLHHGDNDINRGGPAGFWEILLKR